MKPSNPLLLISLALVAVHIFTATASGASGERPNMLIIMADDCTCNDLPEGDGQGALHTATQGPEPDAEYME